MEWDQSLYEVAFEMNFISKTVILKLNKFDLLNMYHLFAIRIFLSSNLFP